jgi:hypothetical protein
MTQGQARQKAKERVRVVRRALRVVDTGLEVMERRLDKLLERKTLITLESFDSLLTNYDGFIGKVQEFEKTLTEVMILFRLLS